MKDIFDRFRQGTILPLTLLLASAATGLVAGVGLVLLPLVTGPSADMRIQPSNRAVMVGDMFPVQIVVESSVSTNVFGGELTFNNDVLFVDSIDYNVSLADLWAEKPWYENGAGTVNFIGGTTREGGFSGTGILMTITFKAIRTGDGVIGIRDARILAHNGLGTDVPLKEPIDALFSVAPNELARSIIADNIHRGASYSVSAEPPPSADLNGDGKQTIRDISIFMRYILGDDRRFDFNQDGEINTKDLSILLRAN